MYVPWCTASKNESNHLCAVDEPHTRAIEAFSHPQVNNTYTIRALQNSCYTWIYIEFEQCINFYSIRPELGSLNVEHVYNRIVQDCTAHYSVTLFCTIVFKFCKLL